MAADPRPDPQPPAIRFTLDGHDLEARADETILEAAARRGLEIPYLCYKPGYRPDGNCRACMVEIESERVLAPACWRVPTEGMRVTSTNKRCRASQKMVLELLLADMPGQGPSPHRHDSELDHWARKLELGRPRFPVRRQPQPDISHPAISVHLDACIQCTRCVRACREEQVNDVIGYAHRGEHSLIVFDMQDPMGESTCVGCGECVQACPTGALMPAGEVGLQEVEREVQSTCPYCGVGCLLSYHVRGNRILYVNGRDGLTNHSRLCVKGRYGFDYVHHPERLKRPLVRRPDCPKSAECVPREHMHEYFREADWDEALDLAAGRLYELRDRHGPRSLAGFGSAKSSNEEAYLFQKLVRTGFGTNNVDHCTRLCHASSVAALLECIGSGAVSNPVADVADAEVIVIIGARPTVNHPVAATFMKNAVRQGKTMILLDPYRSDLARHATHFLQFRPDTDVPLLNGILRAILDENLQNDEFIRAHTSGFEELRANLADYSPEQVAPICGIPARTLREVARIYAKANSAMIFWGMGISQHSHGTDNARCLISLALLTGQIGRPGTGLHPLRGQNNVQGASDVGLIPMMFPDYQPVGDANARKHFEQLWQAKLDPQPGLTVVEIIHSIGRPDGVRGMYVMGENPAMSDPDLEHARKQMAKLEWMVVQDIFFTETAGFADIILPAGAFPEKTGTFTNTDRRVQLGRQAIDPPGEARQDFWITQEIAKRMGLDWHYESPKQVFEELRKAVPSIAGMTWERLEKEHSLIYPLTRPGDPGQRVLFSKDFPTPDGRGRFVPARYRQADELPDQEYPFIFITGRQLEHWHTGSMTRTATVLNTIEPDPVVYIHPEDLEKMGAAPGTDLQLSSRRGHLQAIARIDPGLQPGTLFMAFCYHEAAANLLTNSVLDPHGKIPEFKYCAVHAAPSPPAPQPATATH